MVSARPIILYQGEYLPWSTKEDIFQNSDNIPKCARLQGMYGAITTHIPSPQIVGYSHLLWILRHLGTMPTFVITTLAPPAPEP